MWNNEKIRNHKRAAHLLSQIITNSFQYIKKNSRITEYELQQYILKEFRKNKLKSDKHKPIVAFRRNTSFVHYHPSRGDSKILKPNSLIMIDVWARLQQKFSPFADITWMGFFGKRIPKEIFNLFSVVAEARDASVDYIKQELENKKLPLASQIDLAARDVIKKAGYFKEFPHSTGHSLGFDSPHGKQKAIHYNNTEPIKMNLAYTIEPAIYLNNDFGIRVEMDFYVNGQYKLVITSELQNKIIKI